MVAPAHHTGAPWRPGLPPGVYEALPAPTPQRVEVRMDVAGFVGLTTRGPVGVAVAVSSWEEFTAAFGRPGGGRRLPQAVHGFFANGGRRCVVVRAVPDEARTSRWRLPGLCSAVDRAPLELVAADPGAWGDELDATVRLFTRRPVQPLRVGVAAAGESTHPASLYVDQEPDVAAGALLRWVRVQVADDDRWLEEALRFVVDVERPAAGGGAWRIHLDADLPAPYRDEAVLAGTTEVLAELDVRHDGYAERWPEAGLHPLHPRALPALLAGSRLVRPARVDTPPVVPQETLLGRDWTYTWTAGRGARRVPDRALLNAADAVLAQSAVPMSLPIGDVLDAARLVLERPPTSLARDTAALAEALLTADGPLTAGTDHPAVTDRPLFMSVLDAFDAYDEHNAAEPVTLVHLPDLVHVGPDADPADPRDAKATVTTCFTECGEVPVVAAAPASSPYPLLDVSHDTESIVECQRKLVRRCELAPGAGNLEFQRLASRIAVLSVPPGLSPGQILRWRTDLASQRAVAYAPYLRVARVEDPLASPLVMSPGGVVCGVIARVTRTLGVHRSPANELVAGVLGNHADAALPDAGTLHALRINALRPTERGLAVLGSRTLAVERSWTHLAVRRVVDWLELQLALDSRWAVFEPNHRTLWARLAQLVERRLAALYDAGGLRGASRSEAYFVRADGGTTTGQHVDAGQCVVLVGVAPSVPAEFVVLRLSLNQDGQARVGVIGG